MVTVRAENHVCLVAAWGRGAKLGARSMPPSHPFCQQRDPLQLCISRDSLGPLRTAREVLRLAPQLLRTLEAALVAEEAERALRRLVGGLGDGRVPVDALRLLSLAVRQLGYDDEAAQILRSAVRTARARGDLIGAVDAARRLDSMRDDTETRWSALFAHIARSGFGEPEEDDGFVALTGPTATGTIDEVVRASVELGENAEPTAEPETPFARVPLLADLPVHELTAILRALQLRVAPDGAPLAKVAGGAPAWVTAGDVSVKAHTHPLRAGTFLLPGSPGPRAAGAVRLLTMPVDLWWEYEDSPALREPLHTLRRRDSLNQALRSSAFFSSLDGPGRHRFLHDVQCATLTDTEIIATGEPVRGLYLLVSGAAVVVDTSSGAPCEIARLERGDIFGEFDVLTAGGAEFDVIAHGPVDLCLVEAHAARALLAENPQARRFLVQLTERRQRENAQRSNETSA